MTTPTYREYRLARYLARFERDVRLLARRFGTNVRLLQVVMAHYAIDGLELPDVAALSARTGLKPRTVRRQLRALTKQLEAVRDEHGGGEYEYLPAFFAELEAEDRASKASEP